MQGERGLQGERGALGPTGATGRAGERGPRGDASWQDADGVAVQSLWHKDPDGRLWPLSIETGQPDNSDPAQMIFGWTSSACTGGMTNAYLVNPPPVNTAFRYRAELPEITSAWAYRTAKAELKQIQSYRLSGDWATCRSVSGFWAWSVPYSALQNPGPAPQTALRGPLTLVP